MPTQVRTKRRLLWEDTVWIIPSAASHIVDIHLKWPRSCVSRWEDAHFPSDNDSSQLLVRILCQYHPHQRMPQDWSDLILPSWITCPSCMQIFFSESHCFSLTPRKWLQAAVIVNPPRKPWVPLPTQVAPPELGTLMSWTQGVGLSPLKSCFSRKKYIFAACSWSSVLDFKQQQRSRAPEFNSRFTTVLWTLPAESTVVRLRSGWCPESLHLGPRLRFQYLGSKW